jgi:TetR/AcrR family transcriptional regulator, transcriptional repressor for nem operon
VSQAHRDSPGSGCVLPSLAADPTCLDDQNLRQHFIAVIQEYLDQFAKLAPAMTDASARRDPTAILSEMVGAIILSRVAADPQMANMLIERVTADIVGNPSA